MTLSMLECCFADDVVVVRGVCEVFRPEELQVMDFKVSARYC